MNLFSLLLCWVVSALAILLTAYLLPGVHINDIWVAFVVAVVLGVVNAVVKPVLVALTFPITIVTLGIFLLVINAFLILLVSFFVRGFVVDNFGWAFLFSIVLSLVSSILDGLMS